MVVTPFALIVLLLGTLMLFRGSLLGMFSLFLVSTLFGGSAALILVAAGGSSIPPAQLLLLFLGLRVLLPGAGQMDAVRGAVWDNRFLLIFALYGIISAFTLPTILAQTMSVTPLKPIPGADLFAVRPLHLTSQNYTTAFYLFGTLIAGIAATVAMRRPGSAQRLVKVGPIIAMIHASLGISGALLSGTAWDRVLGFFRNGNYAQLNQSFGDWSRMSGIWPEPSSFAGYATTWCIFMLELWFRDVDARRTGLAGLILLVALIGSTSSTAYVALGVYGLFVLVRFAAQPWSLSARKQLALIAVALAMASLVLGAMVFVPRVAAKAGNILALMTFEKSSSGSGLQRAFWAKQGIDVFFKSYGLGIGAGSFRSSSLLTAILGSMGVIGITAFFAHLLHAVKPFRGGSSNLRLPDVDRAVGAAASATAFLMLIPAMVGSPSPDPGLMWAAMSGIAIALYPVPDRRPRQPFVRQLAAS